MAEKENVKEEKMYLRMINKIGYGAGDFASNYIMSFVSFFIMIYLTDTVGLNGGIIGTLMLVAKLFDGVSDFIFGNVMDRTHTRWGKAKPWMFGSTFPMCLAFFLLFAMPSSGGTVQYVYFFIVYVLLNSVFYTMNNISYASLVSLVTRNKQEQVQMGTIRFIFAFTAMMTLSLIVTPMVTAFGGGARGWKMTALVFAVFATVVNTISCLSVKELPQETTAAAAQTGQKPEKVAITTALKSLIHNKYFILILVVYLAFYMGTALFSGTGAYFANWVLGDGNAFSMFMIANNLPIILGLFITPLIISKVGAYKATLYGMILAVIASVPTVIGAFTGNIPMIVVSLALKSAFMAPLMGVLNMIISEVAGYSLRKDGIHIEGTVFSCASIGNKVGSGIGTAMIGWLMAASGYVGTASSQPQSAITMIIILFTIIPLITYAIIAVCSAGQKVQQANEKWDQEHGAL